MNKEVLVPDRLEQIKWWNALDTVCGRSRLCPDVERGLQLARECRHPDAQWFASLFPAGVAVSTDHLRVVMLDHIDDVRALVIAYRLGMVDSIEPLERAAELGYAPAQALLTDYVPDVQRFVWAQRAVAQLDRDGLFQLAGCYVYGWGCEEDKDKATELYKCAAELEHVVAQYAVGVSYDSSKWERFYWCGRASTRGFRRRQFCIDVLEKLPSFERGEMARILHTAAPAVRIVIVEHKDHADEPLAAGEVKQLQRVLELHDAMLGRARRAMDCWSLVGLRLGVVKDIRIVIAKMAWEEPWRWG
jgi:TPR repeat protein